MLAEAALQFSCQDGAVVQSAPFWVAAGSPLPAGAGADLLRRAGRAVRGFGLQGGGVRSAGSRVVPAALCLLHAEQGVVHGLQ